MSLEELKEKLIKIFRREIAIIKCMRREFDGISSENLLFAQFRMDFGERQKILEENLKMMDRIKMKCVTFGNTSNGKSSILNALLGIDTFPTGDGQATSCFVRIQGCTEDGGYIMDRDNQRQDLEQIKQLTDANCDGHYDIYSELKVFLPQFKCDILREGIEIWDSPGVDYSEKHNEIISKQFRDADVFLLVIDGCSTLNQLERKLFETIKEIITVPSIIFLVNKCDRIEVDKIETVRQQHMEKITKYFVEKLQIYKSQEEIEERIFFVSCHNLELQDKDRVIFDRFKEKLMDDLRINATKRKLKGNVDKVLRFSKEASAILDRIKLFADQKLKDDGLRESLEEIIDKTVEDIQKKFNDLIKDSTFPEGIQRQMKQNTLSQSQESSVSIIDASIAELLTSEMMKFYNEHIFKLQEELKEKFPTVDEYFKRFAQFRKLVQMFDGIRESALKEFFADVEIVFSDKKCEERDLSFSIIVLIIQIKNLIIAMDPDEGNQFAAVDNIGHTLKQLVNNTKTEIQPSRSILSNVGNRLQELVTFKENRRRNVTIIFECIADILGNQLMLLMKNHVQLTKSEIRVKVKECVNKYLKDQQEILALWKRLDGKRIDKKDIMELKKRIDEC